MAKLQNYPRKGNFLDDSTLEPHTVKLPPEHVKKLIKAAMMKASGRSSREILAIPPHSAPEETDRICVQAGLELFVYFRKYCGDPAASAHQFKGRNFRDVAAEQFRTRTLQKERMNSGWRYQFLVVDAARDTHRFLNVGDIGTSAGDFNAIVPFK